MKLITSSVFRLLAVLAMAFTLAISALAQTNAYDDAYHYAYASASWYTNFNTAPGRNEGFGFTTWVVRTNGPNSHGFFSTRNGSPLPAISSPTNYSNLDTNLGPVGSPLGNNNSAHVWGLFANGGTAPNFNSAVMYRGFSNSLDTTVAFKLDWETIGIGSTANNLGGFVLRNGNATNDTADYLTGQRFAFYYVGGGSNSFVFWDGNGVQHIGIPFASNPLSCEFTLKAGDTYRFVVKSLVSGSILAILDGQPLTGSGTIDSVALFANQTSGNQNFNRMKIVSTSLTPPTIINVSPASGSVFVNPATDNVTFEVGSVASNIRGSNVTLRLNGVLQTGLTFNTTGPTNQLFVTNNTALGADLLYNATITVADDNSNTATNNFNFNTFSPVNLSIDAEDYNHGSGQFFPNPVPNAYAGLFGTSGIDYFEVDVTVTNPAALYRVGDQPQILLAGDTVDHAGFLGAGATDYELGYTDKGEWQNYTRNLANTNYTVYARAASGGGGTIMVERLANATATTTDQPKAALGTCIIPATGGSQVYSGQMIPLTDFFGNTVQIRFPGTNTFRELAVNNRAYNLNYLMFVPNTNTATLTPYLSAGYPYPGATGVGLASSISFTIANRQTAVNPATVQLFLDSNNVTGSLTLSNNSAGSVVTYVPPTFLAANSNHVLTAIFTDNGGSPTTTTNTWTFTTVNVAVKIIPAAYAQPPGSGSGPGFALRMNKVSDSAPTTASLAYAELGLAGLITNAVNGGYYTNLAIGGLNNNQYYTETNTINYDITGLATGTPEFPAKSAFPYVPASGTNNNIAIVSLMYLELVAGDYVFTVRSDDGFRLTTGPTPANTNLVLGEFNDGRGNGTPSTIYATVLTNGLYSMRLLYYQAGFGGNVEFYTVKNGTSILINDASNVNAVKSFLPPASAVTIINPAHTAGTTTFDFLTQGGHTHYVEYKNTLTDVSWTPLTTIVGTGSLTSVTDNTASNATRFYRVRSQ